MTDNAIRAAPRAWDGGARDRARGADSGFCAMAPEFDCKVIVSLPARICH
jgi:hypothetical protein